MKIALVGFGKMGRAIRPIVLERGHEVVSIDPTAQDAEFSKIDSSALSGVQVAIDFTTPGVVTSNVELLLKHSVRVVVGTTGWLDHKEQLQSICLEQQGGLIYASNFSIGVNVFSRIVRGAARLLNRVEEYDVGLIELHHRQKIDSPSGTALSLAEVLLEELDRKDEIVFDPLQRAILPHELHCASLRCGSIPGSHEVIFDSLADTISLKHSARGRGGFALGAVLAAEWIATKKGFYTIDDFLADFFSAKTF